MGANTAATHAVCVAIPIPLSLFSFAIEVPSEHLSGQHACRNCEANDPPVPHRPAGISPVMSSPADFRSGSSVRSTAVASRLQAASLSSVFR